VHEVVFVRLVDRTLDAAPVEPQRHVNQRLDRRRDRDAELDSHVAVPQRRSLVDLEARTAPARKAGQGELDQPALLRADPPERRGAGMAEHGAGAASDDRGNPATVISDVRATHRIDPAMQRVQPSRPDPVVNRLGRVPDLAQLIAGHDPVLVVGQIPRLPRHPDPLPPPLIWRLES